MALGNVQLAAQFQQGISGPQQTLLDSRGTLLRDRMNVQQAQLPYEQGLLNQQYGLDTRSIGLEEGGLQAARNRLGATTTLDALKAQLARNSATRESEFATWQTGSEATARDSYTSEGHRRRLANISGQLGETLAGIDIGVAEGKEMTAAQSKELDNQAAQFGIRREQLKMNLDKGLAALGLDSYLNASQIMDMINSNDVDKATLAESLVRQAIATAGQFPESQTRATGPGTPFGASSTRPSGTYGPTLADKLATIRGTTRAI